MDDINLFDNPEPNKKNIDQCYECGSDFKFSPRDRKRGWGYFCSKKCASIYREKYKTESEKRLFKLKKLNL